MARSAEKNLSVPVMVLNLMLTVKVLKVQLKPLNSKQRLRFQSWLKEVSLLLKTP